MNYRGAVRCVGAGLLLGTFLTGGAVAQSDDCRRCVTGGGTRGTLPIFKSGSTANRGVIGNSRITQDADGTNQKAGLRTVIAATYEQVTTRVF